eukprot:GILJ01007561.1.p1 GENE.GILJ01007561.1~~GILJ01007561.1.p1  ORF type:complete len:381 (-),score=51.63 GILJ01007561.1:263-1405(-)
MKRNVSRERKVSTMEAPEKVISVKRTTKTLKRTMTAPAMLVPSEASPAKKLRRSTTSVQSKSETKLVKAVSRTDSVASEGEDDPGIDVSAIFRQISSEERPQNSLKIVSWNVNGLRALLKRQDLLVNYIRTENPDILCLSETKLDTSVIQSVSSLLPGYIEYWNCCETKKGYSGTVLFTKVKPLSITYTMGKHADHDCEGRLINAEYASFTLITVYVPNSGQKLERLGYRTTSWEPDFRGYVKEMEAQRGKPVVVCGDLNVAHQAIDIHSPKTNEKSAGYTKEEREQFGLLLQQGLVDTFRHFHPEKVEYTYWGYRFNARANNKGWRLDYFLVSNPFLPKVLSVSHRTTIPGSDHCPIVLLCADTQVAAEQTEAATIPSS